MSDGVLTLIALGLFAHGTSKWPTMGPWDLGPAVFKLFAFLSIVAMVVLLAICVQLSISISGLQEQIRRLTEESAEIRLDLEESTKGDK